MPVASFKLGLVSGRYAEMKKAPWPGGEMPSAPGCGDGSAASSYRPPRRDEAAEPPCKSDRELTSRESSRS
jgi:hypothetical protein